MKKLVSALLICLIFVTYGQIKIFGATDLSSVLGGQDADNVKTDFLLPQTWDGLPVTWQSSDFHSLFIGDQKAFVIRQGEDKSITLSMQSDQGEQSLKLTIPKLETTKTLLKQDFEAEPPGAFYNSVWQLDETIPAVRSEDYVSIVKESPQNQYLRIKNESAADGIHAMIHAIFEKRQGGVVTMSYRFNARSGTYSNLWLSPYQTNSITSDGLFLRLPTRPGNLVIQGGGSMDVKATTQIWHTLRTDLNITAKTVDIFLDGVCVAERFPAYNGAGAFAKMMFGYARENVGELWIDDVEISCQPLEALRECSDALALSCGSIATENLELPRYSLGGAAEVIWFTSDPNIISNKGVVNRGEVSQEVLLYAMLKDGECRMVKSFSVTVPAALPDSEAVQRDTASLQFPETQYQIYDLYLPSQGNNQTNIAWESSNRKIIDPDTGIVSAPAQGVENVRLTATVSRGKVVGSPVSFDFSVPAPGAAGYQDDNRMSDEDFFGVWQSGKWTTQAKLNYQHPGLQPVEDAVKAGNYALAKERILSYYQSRGLKAAKPTASDKLLTQAYANGIHVFETAALGLCDVSVRETTSQMDVTQYVKNGGNSFLLQSLRRTPGGDGTEDILFFKSKESGTPGCQLVIQYQNGTSRTLAPEADTYIRSGDYGQENYGQENEILVSDGLGEDAARQGLVTFRINQTEAASAIAVAKLRLTGRSDRTRKELMVFAGVENTWQENSVSWDTMPIRVRSWGNQEGGYDWQVHPGMHTQFYNVQIRLYHISHLIASGNPVYIDKGIRQYLDFIGDNGGLEYDTYGSEKALNAGFRGNPHAVSCFFGILESGLIDAEGFTSLLKFMWQEPNALTKPENEWKAHNAAAFQIEALTRYILYFPEFAACEQWKERVGNRVEDLAQEILYQDGGYREATSGYDVAVLNTFCDLFEMCKEAGISLSQAFEEKFRLFARAELFLTKPNGQQWDWGDGSGGNARGYLLNAANALRDQGELRYVATGGKAGKMPAETSLFLPESKLGVMRNSWDAQAVSGFFIGRTGGNHSHAHANHLGIFAYGRYLLTDTGMGAYDSRYPWFQWQSGRSVSHNTVEIDNVGQKKAEGKSEMHMASNDDVDIIQSVSKAYEQSDHERNVLFLKEKGVFIVSDYLSDPKDGKTHRYEQAWHFLAGANPTLDSESGVGKTNFSSGANLTIAPVSTYPTEASVETGAAMNGDGSDNKNITEAGYLSYVQNSKGGAAFQTILYPVAGTAASTVQTEIMTVQDGRDKTASAFCFTLPEQEAGLFYTNHGGGEKQFGQFETDAAVFYKDPQLLAAADVSIVKKDGQTLVQSDVSLSDISLKQMGGQLWVSSSDRIESLYIGMDGIQQVYLNGESQMFSHLDRGILLGGSQKAAAGTARFLSVSDGIEITLPVRSAADGPLDLVFCAAWKKSGILRGFSSEAFSVQKNAETVVTLTIPQQTGEGQVLELYLLDQATLQPYMEKREYDTIPGQ